MTEVVEVGYCTRDDVKNALDVPETARVNRQIDREILGSSRGIEGDLGRYFYPTVSVQTFDWPDHQFSAPWRLWLDQRELVSVTAVVAAGIDITDSVFLRPDDAPLRGRPFTAIEINLATNAAFNAGNTFQRSIAVTGTFGYTAAENPAGTVSAFADATGTTATVSDSSLVGVGSLIRVGTERMQVTAKRLVDSGQFTTGDLAIANNATVIPVSSPDTIQPGEVITVDGEKMLVEDATDQALIVVRAWDGSTLAAHTAPAAVWLPRQITVERGILGTTAAQHSAGPLAVHRVPPLIRDLCIAETLSTLNQERRGYTQVVKRTTGGGSPGDPVEVSTGLDDLRKRAAARYLRVRTRTAARLI